MVCFPGNEFASAFPLPCVSSLMQVQIFLQPVPQTSCSMVASIRPLQFENDSLSACKLLLPLFADILFSQHLSITKLCHRFPKIYLELIDSYILSALTASLAF